MMLMARRKRERWPAADGSRRFLCGLARCNKILATTTPTHKMDAAGAWYVEQHLTVAAGFVEYRDELGVYYKEKPSNADARKYGLPHHRRGTSARLSEPQDQDRIPTSPDKLPVRLYCPAHPEWASWFTAELLA